MWLQRQLAEGDDLSGFDCGVDELNNWLREHAIRAHRQRITRAYVWVDEAEPHTVVAYAAIQPTQVTADDLTRGLGGGHSRVPGYLIARLGLHQELQGQGLGVQLLLGTLEVCVDASAVGGGRIIVVDPIEAATTTFYEKYGFVPTLGAGSRLVMKVATAAAAIGG